jgi:predicted O-methyltransferase YrrM
MEKLFAVIGDRMFDTLVELGCWQGGSAWLLSSFIKPGGSIILVDYMQSKAILKKTHFVMAALRTAGYAAKLFNMTTEAALPHVRKALGNQHNNRIYLHIDADHQYDAVAWDYNNYSQIVSPGGVIQLHDIALTGQSTRGYKFDVHKLWAEIKGNKQEVIDTAYVDPQPTAGGHIGIGLVWV